MSSFANYRASLPGGRALLLIGLIALLSSCSRKAFQPVAEPWVLLLSEPGKSIEILQQPMKRETISWTGREVAALEVEGELRIEFDDSYYFYLQLNCPPELRCNGSKAYVPATLVYGFDPRSTMAARYDLTRIEFKQEDREAVFEQRPFQLLPREHLDAALALKAWMIDPGLTVPGVTEDFPLESLLDAHLRTLPLAERETKVAEWFFLSVSFEKALRNTAFVPYLRPYQAFPAVIQVATGKSSEEAGFTPEQDLFLRKLSAFSQTQFEAMAAEMGQDFPFQAKTFDALARFFNEQLRLPLYKALIFKQILDDVPFEAIEPRPEQSTETAEGDPDVGTAARRPTPVTNVLYDLEFGAVVSYKTAAGKTEERIFPEIKAIAHENGLGFDLRTADGEELRVLPLKTASMLAAANPEALLRFRKLPQSAIMAAESYARRAMLTAIKYGVGRYDRKERRFQYTLKLSDPNVYPHVVALLKSAPAVDEFDAETKAGSINAKELSMVEGAKLSWSIVEQPDAKYTALKVAGEYTICERGCFDEKVDRTCLNNNQGSEVELTFSGPSLNAANPEVGMYRSLAREEGQPEEYGYIDPCNTVFQSGLF